MLVIYLTGSSVCMAEPKIEDTDLPIMGLATKKEQSFRSTLLVKNLIYAALCAAALFMPTVAFAGPILHRQAHQQQRIYKGVQNGSLTAKEYRNLQRRERSIAAQRYRDVHDGGGLNRYERQRLNARLNNLSHDIYRYKHN
jgi:hypothetical protein